MRFVYANAEYRIKDTRGRNVHIGQFIHQAVAMGHEVWMRPGSEHSEVRILPDNRLSRWLTLYRMELLYIRLQGTLPDVARYALPPYRQLIGSPLNVWEFNTVPEFQKTMGENDAVVARNIAAFRKFGSGCDLAICVSNRLAEYVHEKLGLQRVATVTNGSDPDLFRPDIFDSREFGIEPGFLNVVWIGSADIAWHNIDLMKQTALWLSTQPGRPKVAFHLIGTLPGNTDDLGPNIRYHGPQPYTALPAWLAGMDIGLCLYQPGPADFSSPLKLFDYLSCGLTVVSTAQPQICEILSQLEANDLVVPTDDPQALGKTLLRLADNRHRMKSLGERGRRLVIEKFNWKNLVEEIFKQIESVREEKIAKKTDRLLRWRNPAPREMKR